MKKKVSSNRGRAKKPETDTDLRFHPAKIDSLFPVLDAIAFLDSPDAGFIAQFAGIDPRTAGKLLKNAEIIGLVQKLGDRQFTLPLAYPHKGSVDQKKAVVREALFRLPILVGVRQFLQLGDNLESAARKAATVQGIRNYDPKDFSPLLEWSNSLGALNPGMTVEDLLDEAVKSKQKRHVVDQNEIVAFLSHSSKDKPFIRQIAGDLTAEKIGVWLDEQRILPGDSIPNKIAQGLALSDFFLIAISRHSVDSAWVQKELDNALVHEIEQRRVTIIPLRLDDTTVPEVLRDKKYVDFSKSYKQGFDELTLALRRHHDG